MTLLAYKHWALSCLFPPIRSEGISSGLKYFVLFRSKAMDMSSCVLSMRQTCYHIEIPFSPSAEESPVAPFCVDCIVP